MGDAAFILKPGLSNKRVAEVAESRKEEAKYVAARLNERLKSAVAEAVGPDRPGLARLIETASLDYRKVKESDLHTVIREKLLAGAERNPALKAEAEEALKALETAPSIPIGTLLNLDSPLKDHPLLAADYRKEKLLRSAELLGLKETQAAKLAAKDIVLEDLNDAIIDSLVTEKVITAKQKKELQLISDLSRLGGENFELINALKAGGASSVEDFIAWESADWLTLIKGKKVTIPANEESAGSYAENLREGIEQAYPTPYFLNRIIKSSYEAELKTLDNLAVLERLNPSLGLGTRAPEEMEWTGIAADARAKLEQERERLARFANTYRYLDIQTVADDRKLTAAQRKEIIGKRLAALDTFYKNNPGLDLEVTDFLDKRTKLNWAGIDEAERPRVKRQMMAFQRTMELAGDAASRQKLLGTGLDAAVSVAGMTEGDFLKLTGLALEKGREVYKKALGISDATAHFMEAFRDAEFGLFRMMGVTNQGSLVNDLRDLEGYEDLFGRQDFCDCEDCRSVLGPAAYFTDLMYFVQEHVSKKVFLPGHAQHPLYLRNRRPDLWKLPLTCANTTTELPYLTVVNEVLEQYLKQAAGAADAYDLLRNADVSCALPFTLPLEELRTYLKHFELSLFDIYRALKEPAAKLRREKLQLSEEELALVKTPAPGQVRRRFGNRALDRFPVKDFVRMAGIRREELDDLLGIAFLPEVAKVSVALEQLSNDIQDYDEVLKDLTEARLDLIHRFLRLWEKTGWTIKELDLILNALKAAGLAHTLESNDAAGSPEILRVADTVLMREALELSAEELASLVYQIPDKPFGDSRTSFYDRLFDREKIFGVAAVAPDGTRTYNQTAVLPADRSLDKITTLLLAGLGISESDLGTLFSLLNINRAVDVNIDRALLSRLYRQARIAKGLGWTIEEYGAVLRLAGSGAEASSPDDVLKLVAFREWLQPSPFGVAELKLILLGEESASLHYQNTRDSLAAKVLDIQTSDQTDKKGLLLISLQELFTLTPEQLKNELLPAFSSVDINGAGIAKALNAAFTNGRPDTPADLDALVTMVRELERVQLLFKMLEFDASAITWFIGHKEVFGIADLKSLNVTHLRAAAAYRTLAALDRERGSGLRAALEDYQATHHFSAGAGDFLAGLLGRPPALIKSVAAALPLPATALMAYQQILDLLQLCRKLGIEGPSLVKLKATDYAGLKVARDIALGAFASKYADEGERRTKLEPYGDRINTLKRDALCAYILGRSDAFKFRDRSDLYGFFLLDVEMSGCFRTSRLVAAIGSLQLYVHRCLINLEQSDLTLNPAIHNLKVNPTLIPVGEWEWRKNYRVWEANRKVFLYPELYIDPALRDNKTHLFRELEEELLQEKISQESAEAAYKKYLAQFADLTRLRYAGACYHSVYEPTTVDLSKEGLVIKAVAGAGETNESCYYLFARTNVHPYQYYYRTYNHYKKVWGNWEKLDLVIEAAEISALFHRGRLSLYWTEVTRKEMSSVKNGNAEGDSALFKVYVKYSFLNEHGKWNAPQRLYLGFTHAEERKIFERVQYTYPSNEKERDRKHDAVFESYEQKVFRKPYALLSGSTDRPVSLFHIWSQNRGVQQVRYWTDDYTYAHPLIEIRVPAAEFIVTNDQFNLTKQVTFSMKINFGTWTFAASFAGTLILQNASSCVLTMEKTVVQAGTISITINEFSLPVPVHAATLPVQIKVSKAGLSLARNEIDGVAPADLMNATGDLTGSAVFFLKKEYDVAFSESGYFIRYVEDGSEDFTERERKLQQAGSGEGLLSIDTEGSLEAVPLTTVLTDELSSILFDEGVESFLSLRTQLLTLPSGQQLDFDGPYGAHYWELFFHIPFLIAHHLNANQKFKEAKWWYERIFNPTGDETPADARPTDHNWQFRRFRGLTIEKLKAVLTDEQALEAYREDPFNPHAIARLRLNAYQKAIVMKYIDNLIDWGDHLFAQDTRESINEAEMLYQMAADILGSRPVKRGACKTALEKDLTYERIAPGIGAGTEFLITLENVYSRTKKIKEVETGVIKPSKRLRSLLGGEEPTTLAAVAEAVGSAKYSGMFVAGNAPAAPAAKDDGKKRKVTKHEYKVKAKQRAKEKVKRWADEEKFKDKIKTKPPKRRPGSELVKQSALAFCVPQNKELLKYWDRVEDRLFKIRHCMNIKGIRRSLSLFQPPIDPMLLVKARAAGLSLEDIGALLTAAGAIPPYRFSFLVEKARLVAQTVQSFGSALLSALEKKDNEELVLLKSVHERTILKMTRDIKKRQLAESRYQLKALEESIANVQQRADYYQGLIDGGLIGWETTQQIATHTASGLETAAAIQKLIGGILFLIPQLGSPFAMKYGGSELGNSAQAFGEMMRSTAAIAHAVAASAGLEAGYQRREQEWKQQLKVAQAELRQLEQQRLAAEVRTLIAERDLEVHETSMEQAAELHDFYRDKFTSLGLYNYLASTLNRLYRQAYEAAYDMAKLAERACRFELDETETYIANDNWQYDRAGLLAGERLMLQLHKLEQAYIEKNVRIPEISQSFSLALLDPLELVKLRQTGACTIRIPEIAFELLYPGHYKRLIKSVRITIPCVVGPYTNVSARLTLLKGEVEPDDKAALTEVSVGKNTSIATSGGLNDAGMFEFSFRDERYLPFEGGGAISEWSLELPSAIRSFNYDTIADVVMHISYTAREGDRTAAETALAAAVTNYAAAKGLFRLFSMKHEFPAAFSQLVEGGAAQKTEVTLGAQHFPYLFGDKPLALLQTKIYLKPKRGKTVAAPAALKMGTVAVAWDAGEDIAMTGSAGEKDKLKGGAVALQGSPLQKWSIDAGDNGLDKDAVEDILVLMKYKVTGI
ncbi:MAG: neuraminidase-like domain-containing protein [Nitrospirota bacterium]